jgi:hypothetical protein
MLWALYNFSIPVDPNLHRPQSLSDQKGQRGEFTLHSLDEIFQGQWLIEYSFASALKRDFDESLALIHHFVHFHIN